MYGTFFFLFQIWGSNSRRVNINLTNRNKHGKIYIDGMFVDGGFIYIDDMFISWVS